MSAVEHVMRTEGVGEAQRQYPWLAGLKTLVAELHDKLLSMFKNLDLEKEDQVQRVEKALKKELTALVRNSAKSRCQDAELMSRAYDCMCCLIAARRQLFLFRRKHVHLASLSNDEKSCPPPPPSLSLHSRPFTQKGWRW